MQITAARLPGASLVPELAERLARRSGGNPLFLRSMLDQLGGRAVLCPGDNSLTPEVAAAVDEVPAELKELLRLQLSRLAPFHRTLLEAAAVVAPEFSPLLVSQLLDDGSDAEAVEEACEELIERGPFLSR